jgi:hypothetical protein
MISLLDLPSYPQTEWFDTVESLESTNSVFCVLGAMYLIRLPFEKPFSIFDRLGCQKCVATRKIVPKSKQSLPTRCPRAGSRSIGNGS